MAETATATQQQELKQDEQQELKQEEPQEQPKLLGRRRSSLSELLTERQEKLEIKAVEDAKPPLGQDPQYGKYVHMYRSNAIPKPAIVSEMDLNGLDPKALDMRHDRPYGWVPTDDDCPEAPTTPRTTAGMRAVFSMFDQGSGKLNSRSLGACLQKLGVKYDKKLMEKAIPMFSEKAEFEFEQFVEMFLTMRMSSELHCSEGVLVEPMRLTPSELEGARKSFDAIDLDSSGWIDGFEMKKILDSMEVESTQEEVDKLLRHVDLDGNGNFEFEEFVNMIEVAKARHADKQQASIMSATDALAAIHAEKRATDRLMSVALGAALSALQKGECSAESAAQIASHTVRAIAGSSPSAIKAASDAAEMAKKRATELVCTELFIAAECGDLTKAKEAIAKGANAAARTADCDDTFRNMSLATASSTAASWMSTDFLSPEEIYVPGGNASVLHLALQNGHCELALYLLDQGGDPNAVDNDGVSLLMVAATSFKTSQHFALVLKLLQSCSAMLTAVSNSGWSTSTFAATFGRDQLLRKLCKAGAPVDAPTEWMTSVPSPLMKASHLGHLACVEYLVNSTSAKIDVVDHRRRTALDMAEACDRRDVVDFLKSKGARRGVNIEKPLATSMSEEKKDEQQPDADEAKKTVTINQP